MRRLDQAAQHLAGFWRLQHKSCVPPILFGFLIPTTLLVNWTILTHNSNHYGNWRGIVLHLLRIIILDHGIALLIAYANRLFNFEASRI